jgi:iron complex transport system ATP-binding protein
MMVLSYGNHRVMDGLSLEVRHGEIVTIIGANGSGKSTLLKAISRNLKPQSGTVYLDGKAILSLDTKEVARTLAVLPQIHSVPDDFTVGDLVSYGRFPHLGAAGRLGYDDFDAVKRAIGLTKLTELRDRPVATLSGGEQQRAWIAMALAQEPRIMLLDEPTTFLDISHQFELLELISQLNREIGLTIIMVLHDLNQASRYSHRLIVLKDGGIYREGPPVEIISKKILSEVFHITGKIFTDQEYGSPYFLPLGSSGE